ncbi:hypothetical protein [Derxia gummosa]|uniref:Uncharacterized protein n=1 Tax=Derxia gummosa DSM 723 TaxID=1121388 RepID=A0A8B6X2U0_9BURK|nr:hypothetical protein [Derxia gummosa]
MRRAARALTLALLVACAGARAEPVTIDDIAPEVVEAVRATGLVGAGLPVRGFTWKLEQRRPFRGPRTTVETLTASADGASPAQSETTLPDGRMEYSEYLSVRGLLRLGPNDKTLGITASGLALPLVPGRQFKLSGERDGMVLDQACTARSRVPATQLHESLPGDAVLIDCAGEGKYRGLTAQVTSEVVWLAKLNVFLDRHDVFDSPLGRFEFSRAVLDFRFND